MASCAFPGRFLRVFSRKRHTALPSHKQNKAEPSICNLKCGIFAGAVPNQIPCPHLRCSLGEEIGSQPALAATCSRNCLASAVDGGSHRVRQRWASPGSKGDALHPRLRTPSRHFRAAWKGHKSDASRGKMEARTKGGARARGSLQVD